MLVLNHTQSSCCKRQSIDLGISRGLWIILSSEAENGGAVKMVKTGKTGYKWEGSVYRWSLEKLAHLLKQKKIFIVIKNGLDFPRDQQ